MDGHEGQDGDHDRSQRWLFDPYAPASTSPTTHHPDLPHVPLEIAVGVVPLLVVVGWIIGQDLTLYFEVRTNPLGVRTPVADDFGPAELRDGRALDRRPTASNDSIHTTNKP